METAETKKDVFEIDFLTNKENYYLSNNERLSFGSVPELDLRDIAFYRIDEISFEDKAPRKEALENVLSTMRLDGTYFVYLLMGDSRGVHFYYGVSKDYSMDKELELSIYDIGNSILEPGIRGNFRGSKIKEVEAEEKRELVKRIDKMRYFSMLEGVPGYTKEDEKFQGVDRLVDVMLGDNFGFMIIAKPLNYDDVKAIESNLYDVYTRIVPFAKKSKQAGISENVGTSKGTTSGTSSTLGKNYSKTKQDSVAITTGVTEGTNTSDSVTTNSGDGYDSKGTSRGGGKSKGTSRSEAKTTGGSESEGTNTSEATNKSVNEQTNQGTSKSDSTTLEYVDKKSQDWIKYLDEVIIPRLDYGTGKGIFMVSSFLFSENKAVLKKLENTSMSLFSGETGNKIPLKAIPLGDKAVDKKLEFFKNFQLPVAGFSEKTSVHEPISRSALSQYVSLNKKFALGNWITTNELAMIAGLPQKDVVGLGLREEVEFGLNFRNDIPEEETIRLGRLVQSGNVLDNIEVSIDKRNLDKHMFITGVTGSGKTTTCQKILLDSKLPFLVIEPAKTEYRILTEHYDDLLVFTLGNDTVGPFRLNPFEFFPHESITSRVDMIKASIEAAFDMDAAIPQLIETAIYECYKDYGWNVANNKNSIYGEKAFEPGVYAFPTLEDLIWKVEEVVKDQGFDDRLKNDYIGSIRARLQGLLVGSKGLMLNTKRSINFENLLEHKVVLELEEIRSATEKSLVMGFVLTNLMEAIRARYLKKGACGHITLVEEAHRLLSKYEPGESPNKKHGVETFSDMLAEIRKYGESLMIVDQIPNKLTPEVLKNTNTKIVHKLFAEDDKEAIGNTIVLEKEQKEFLSNLETGRAVVFSQGFSKAVQVQIDNVTNTTGRKQIGTEVIQDMVLGYYAEQYKTGIMEGSQYFDRKPSLEQRRMLLDVSREEDLYELCLRYAGECEDFDAELVKKVRKVMEQEERLFVLLDNTFTGTAEKKARNAEAADCLKEISGTLSYEWLGYYLAKIYYGKVQKDKKGVKKFSENSVKILTQFAKDYVADTLGEIRPIKTSLKVN